MHPSLQRSGGLQPGRTLAERYEILDVRVSDAVVSACRARDLLSSREVNVFCFHTESSPGMRVLDQFRRDISRLRTVTHPNVAQVIDAGDDGPLFYVAIEACEGRLLSDRLRDTERLQPAEAAEIFEGLARGLAALHNAGLAHLDVRPSRILLLRGAIKLLPFDLERDVRQMRAADPVTRFAWSAPEYVLGRAAAFPADVYSAAAVAYEILAGYPPHAGAPLHTRCSTVPPAVAGVPQSFSELLEQCLQPEPASRFQSAAALSEACSVLRQPAPAQHAAARTMTSLLKDDPQDPSAVVPLILAICPVLRGIHERGRAHRDPAPDNIILTDAGGVDMPSSDPPPPNATMMVEDPKYTAPELLLSRLTAGGTAHVLADIYVLGFGAYELLAGRTQFNRQFGGADGPQEHLAWMNWHADTAKRLPPLRELAPNAPQSLCELIDRMVRKNPAERVQSLEDVAKGLRHLEVRLEDTQEFEVKAFTHPPPKRKSRARFFFSAAALVLIVAAVAGWFALRSFGLEERGFQAALQDAYSTAAAWLPGAPSPQSKTPGAPSRTLATASGPMVLIPAGEFTMGGDAAPNERPEHRLTLPAYYLDQFEVTNNAYKQFCDRTHRPYPRAPGWAPDYFTRASHPVLNVTWDDARSFCAAAGKRLPSEAEWEKAARGGDQQTVWSNWRVSGLANLGTGGRGAPAPVGSYGADVSPYGVADMAGNVHEWTADDYALYPGNKAALPPAAPSKVVRGGSYAISANGLSPHWRASLAPDLQGRQDLPVGFRCAADVP
ncbi:MAG TPA: SUMF1/EgtB/PvdO family nonheme iron enzyme, partial [Bryobacteraceae bacterium]|nr:SUMF1/EgtB/PvdO family nonheme iron enzyme [Bryobacteraceae bacterium]